MCSVCTARRCDERLEASDLADGAAELEIGLDGVVEGVEVVVVALDSCRLGVENLGVGAALLDVSAAGDAQVLLGLGRWRRGSPESCAGSPGRSAMPSGPGA